MNELDIKEYTLDNCQKSPKTKLPNIYVLELKDGRYYVGETKNIIVRITQHILGEGSLWTKKYPPIRIMHIRRECCSWYETLYTLRLAKKHGISVEDLLNSNPGISADSKITSEMELVVEKMVLPINIMSVYISEYEKSIDFKTKKNNDKSLYKGRHKL